MRSLVITLIILWSCQMKAQELFVVTEPASNAPAGSLGFKFGESLMKEKYKDGYNYHMMPEVT